MAKIIIDTSDLDEAIVKVKILNEELEKAISQMNNLTNLTNWNCNSVAHGSVSVIAENLKPFGLSSDDVDSIVRTVRDRLKNDIDSIERTVRYRLENGIE